MINFNVNYIIAIGASAGGMEEIHEFFDNTPLDDVSYIIVQHLSADFKSHMVELLAKHSKLKVTEAEENMMVEPNQVYFIPNNKFMAVYEGRLHLSAKGDIKPPHLTINVFFESLAIECGDKVIAVILSGMGSDGSEGIKTIKKAGGMVIASDPALTEFGSMPSSAIATGAVDFVLEPKMMPGAIVTYIESQGALQGETSKIKEQEEIVKEILALIKGQLRFDFSAYKPATICRRIKKRAREHNFHKLEDYLSFLKRNTGEIQSLANTLLISVTTFFRDPEAFEFIEKNVIPDIITAHVPGKEIKLWIVGCATGEEAYSFAMLIYEQLKDEEAHTFVKVFATDIDSNALAHAGKGIYNKDAVKTISPERLEKFFTKEKNDFRVKPQLRKMVIFAEHNIAQNPPYSNLDFISCRNVLIYMLPVLQKKIFNMLHFGLKRNGYLFLGLSENAHPEETGFELTNQKWKIYKNTDTKRAFHFEAFSLPVNDNEPSFPKAIKPAEQQVSKKINFDHVVSHTLVDNLKFLVICIDMRNQVLKTYGDTTAYLLQKNFNLNLTELLPEPLALAFDIAKGKALKEGNKVVIDGIKATNASSFSVIQLQVTPLKVEEEKMLMVVFSDGNANDFPKVEGEIFNTNAFINQYRFDREEELRDIKEKQSISEEKLEASLENVQSYNEELLTANEEMQSLIEEMHTINKDYQLKNNELIEVNDDLNNYFRSNQNGQLFVDTDLLLMKFSPGTIKHINLVETDIGRPITNISTNIKFETIIPDIKKVIKSGETIQREAEATNGKWYQLTTMPYIQKANNLTAGAIISFNDITKLKEIQNELDKANNTLKLVNSDLNNFVHAASHDLLGPLGNIESIISLIREANITEAEMPQYMEMIDNSVKKFRGLVKEMATVGKIESEMFVLEPVNFCTVIEEIRLSISKQIALTNATLTLDLKVEEINFSKKNLRSILYNLISNALKYKSKERNPVILITSVKEQDYVILSIKDNGLGMEKEKVHKIFDLYTRIKTDVEGQGIGLYLAKKIIDASGGKVTVESEQGQGSTFTIYFKDLKKSLV